MSAEKERLFLRLFKFSFDVSQRVVRVYTEENILKSDSLADFVSKHKHVIYHLWSNKVRCCDCNNYPSHVLPPNQVLYKDSQLDKLFNKTNKHNHSHFVKNNSKVLQHCICAIKVISTCSLEELDVTFIHILLRNCTILPPDDEDWFREIIDVRNKVSHATSTISYDITDLNSLWKRLENAVLGLAGKIKFKPFATGIGREIKYLSNINLTKEDITEIIECVDENKNLVTSLKDCLEENMRKVVAKQDALSSDMKQLRKMIEVCLEKETGECKVDIDHLKFDVQYLRKRETDNATNVSKAHVKQDVSPVEPSASNLDSEDQAEDDQASCEVRWHLSTPDDWNVQRIKKILQDLTSISSTLGSFKIRFVYDGSLVIQTTTSRETIEDKEKLEVAIELFLKELVKKCNIETGRRQTVKVEITLSGIVGICDSSMKDLISSNVICPHCDKLINCDPCHKKIQLIKDLTMTVALTDTKKTAIRAETEKGSQKKDVLEDIIDTDKNVEGKRTIDENAVVMKNKTNPMGQSTAQAVIEKKKYSGTEEENHLHLVFVLTNMARRAVKLRFDQTFSFEQLEYYLEKNYHRLQFWREKKIITDEQFILLYPNYSSHKRRILGVFSFTPEVIHANCNSDTYDLDLMITFLKHEQYVYYGRIYRPSSHNLKRTLLELDHYRNVLINSDPFMFDDAKYNKILDQLKSVISELGSKLPEEYDHYQVRILNT